MASQMIKLEMRSIPGWTRSSRQVPHDGVSGLVEDMCDCLREIGATDEELLGLMRLGGDATLDDIAKVEASVMGRTDGTTREGEGE